jgi:phosphatidylinositol alpha-1,6-mannosyltransferase
VVFHGELNHLDLVSVYQQCDVFALPNHGDAGDIEGFGIVLLEAQACGRPVVAGESGGTIEAMNSPRSGHVIPSLQRKKLVRTLVDLLGDGEQRERMGQEGREWVVKNFDWPILAEQASLLFSGRVRQPDRSSETDRILVASR